MNTDTQNAVWADTYTCPKHWDAQSEDMGLEQCPWNADCEDCQKEQTARMAVIDQLQAQAQQRAAGLAKSGVEFPRAVQDSIRLELLLDVIFRDPRNRALYEAECGRRVVNELKNAQAMVKEAAEPKIITPEQKRLHVVKNDPRG